MNTTGQSPARASSAQLDPREAASIIDAQRSAYLKRLEVRSAPILLAWAAAWIAGLPATWWIMALAGGGGMLLYAVVEMIGATPTPEGQ